MRGIFLPEYLYLEPVVLGLGWLFTLSSLWTEEVRAELEEPRAEAWLGLGMTSLT